MNAKLTLSIEQEVIEQAKKYAKSQGRSLSNVVEEYLKSVGKKYRVNHQNEFHPLVEELCGSVKVPKDKSYDEIIGEAIIDKYNTR